MSSPLKKRARQENIQFISGLAVLTSTNKGYRSAFQRFRRFVQEEIGRDILEVAPPIDLGLLEELAAEWLEDCRMEGNKGKGCKAVSVHDYAKNLSAALLRVPHLRGLRPLTKGGVANDLRVGLLKMMGTAASDTFEAPTRAETELQSEALEGIGWTGEAVACEVFWESAGRCSDLLETRICDVRGNESALRIKIPVTKPNSLLRVGEWNEIVTPSTRVKLLRWTERRRAEEGTGCEGKRLWPLTTRTFLRRVQTAEGAISTARAFRRGLIHHAFGAGLEAKQICGVSHHKSAPMVGRYTDSIPEALRRQQMAVVVAAAEQGR